MRAWKLTGVAACALVALALPSYGGLITSWETGLEGWAARPGATLAPTATAGVTNGSSALRVSTTGGQWNETMVLDGAQYAAGFAGNNVVSLDVTASAADVPTPWLFVWFAFNVPDLFWIDSGPINIPLDGRPHTISWNYQQAGVTVDPNPYWFQFYLPTMSGNGGAPTVAFTFDNLRTSNVPTVPEPECLSLVAAGVALLLRRGRRG